MRFFEENIDMLAISGISTRVHQNEMEEGDARPDLDAFAIGGKGL